MKYGLFWTLGFIALGAIALATGPAQAQTTAPGPYYATPSWDQTIACTTKANCPRFIVLSNMNGAGVLDRETGLVWERSLGTGSATWNDARLQCANRILGGRMGWRLPSVQELASLLDASDPPTLPAGHPFANVQSSFYWSATTWAGDTSLAWRVLFGALTPTAKVTFADKSFNLFVWCVRGGMNADQY